MEKHHAHFYLFWIWKTGYAIFMTCLNIISHSYSFNAFFPGTSYFLYLIMVKKMAKHYIHLYPFFCIWKTGYAIVRTCLTMVIHRYRYTCIFITFSKYFTFSQYISIMAQKFTKQYSHYYIFDIWKTRHEIFRKRLNYWVWLFIIIASLHFSTYFIFSFIDNSTENCETPYSLY